MSDQTTQSIVDRLRAAPDMKDKAVIAGLSHAPAEADGLVMSCENCIYFLGRRGWCDLPELNIRSIPNGTASCGGSEG